MRVKKRLLAIFGPIILAAVMMLAVLLAPFWAHKYTASPQTQQNAATSLSPVVLKGQLLKQSALKNKYVPFFGSSEWSRIDPFHPATLARKYHRSYRPFLLGARGTQSLTHFFDMQSINGQLKRKRAVFFISPQWFVSIGENPNAFSYYYSPLQTVTWIRNETGSAMDQYAAKRLLAMPSGNSDKIIAAALHRIEQGSRPTKFQMAYVNTRHRILLNEDQIFSRINVPNKNSHRVLKSMKLLPKTYNYRQLNRLAGKIGKRQTNSNRFDVSNKFWNRRLKAHVKRLKNFQKHLSYLKSPEYSDFQLVLNQFAKDKTEVLFIIPPINHKWQVYTGLSSEMLARFNQKITYQLRSQGFNHIDNLSQDGRQPYFMTDTIHPGWRGWLAMDRQIRPFLTRQVAVPKYHLNNKFYSEKWQQAQ